MSGGLGESGGLGMGNEAKRLNENSIPIWLKRALVIMGIFLALPGLLLAFIAVIYVIGVLWTSDPGAALGGVFILTLLALTLLSGSALFWHATQSLRHKPSATLRLPTIWVLMGTFGFCLVLAGAISGFPLLQGLLFPPLFVLAAALPPLWAVAWFGAGCATSDEHLTWRRGVLTFIGGATVGVGVAIVLEILLPAFVLALILDVARSVLRQVESLLDALASQRIADALTNPGFLYLLVQLAVIAPLAEEVAKPLVTLPLLKRLSRYEAFWVGALAGAGFAALENVLYAGFGYFFWAGILVVRALGSAIHPLGAGLVAVAWRDIVRGEPGAWRTLFKRFGLAVGMHALWNGGSLIAVTLASAQFFGELPPDIAVLGLSAGGTTLALLAVLGLGALWMGRAVARMLTASRATSDDALAADVALVFNDRAVALWAIACVVAIVPAGITGLKLWFW